MKNVCEPPLPNNLSTSVAQWIAVHARFSWSDRNGTYTQKHFLILNIFAAILHCFVKIFNILIVCCC